jgi:hypothetical protein
MVGFNRSLPGAERPSDLLTEGGFREAKTRQVRRSRTHYVMAGIAASSRTSCAKSENVSA